MGIVALCIVCAAYLIARPGGLVARTYGSKGVQAAVAAKPAHEPVRLDAFPAPASADSDSPEMPELGTAETYAELEPDERDSEEQPQPEGGDGGEAAVGPEPAAEAAAAG